MRFATTLISVLLLAASGCDKKSNASTSSPPPTAVAAIMDPGAGDVTGTVMFTGQPRPSKTLNAAGICCPNAPAITDETVVVNPNGTLKSAVVYLKDAPAGLAYPSLPPATLDQINCQYVPHVVALMTNQLLQVKSSDPTLHNFHTLAKLNKSENLSLFKAGDFRSVSFQTPEFLRVACDVHPWMTAHIAVFNHPFFAVTDEHGAFEIKNLPPGQHTLTCWQERLGTRELQITIAHDHPTTASFTFTPPALNPEP